MKHFLIVYDQAAGHVLSQKEFSDDERTKALDERFALERHHADDPNLEVIVLSGKDRGALETTHARYFKDVQALASD